MAGVMDLFKLRLLQHVLRETEENKDERQSEQPNQGPNDNETGSLRQPQPSVQAFYCWPFASGSAFEMIFPA